MSDQLDSSELSTTTTSSFQFRWNDAGSGATRDGGFWHPRTADEFRPLGSVGVKDYKDINGNHSALLIRAKPNGSSNASPVSSPIGYTQIWKDEGSKADKNGSFWRPIPPNGYVSLGDVAIERWSPEPSLGDIWCVREDLVKAGSFSSSSIWDDKKSGSKKDVSIWEIQPNHKKDLGAIRASQNYSSPDAHFAVLPIL